MRWKVFAVALLGLAGAGCESSGPKTVPVSGTLKINGSPVEGVEVQFITQEFAGFGKTDAEGKFKLTQGAVVGPNKICLRKFDAGELKDDPQAGMDAGQFGAMQQAQGAKSGIKQLIPPQYTDVNTTKLEFDVPEKGTTAADFNL